MGANNTSDFLNLLQTRRQHFRHYLTTELRRLKAESKLHAAMRYALFNGGKHMRPLLAYAAVEAVGGHFGNADIPACAVELIHAYSLIHDDLPAMDDDVLRRGLPTCHVVYGEATAILAGDALQSLAFELLGTSPRLPCGDRARLLMLGELARASGSAGMVGGQALDIDAAGSILNLEQLQDMHRKKTGALISAAVVMGALSYQPASGEQIEALRKFADLAGLAFQIRDDLMDVESSTAVSGKEQGKDARLNKPTYSSILGMAGARTQLQQTANAALEALSGFGKSAQMLRQLLQYIVERQT